MYGNFGTYSLYTEIAADSVKHRGAEMICSDHIHTHGREARGLLFARRMTSREENYDSANKCLVEFLTY